MENSLKNLTILVNTCDAYEDLWAPFFKLFKKYGEELTSCPIVLNTESKKFKCEDLNVLCPNSFSVNTPWGKRLKETLINIKTDYVLFLLDDFFLQRPANTKTISKCISWLDKNSQIGAFNLLSLKDSDEPSADFENFCFIQPEKPYRLNSQACVWRKDVLINSILDSETPWDWETYGNKRNSILLKDIDFYCISELTEEPYFYNSEFHNKKYSKDKVRNAVIRGKWDLSCIEQCFKDNDIEIDYSIRGLYNPKKDLPQNPCFLKRCLRKLYRTMFFFKFSKQKQALREKHRVLVDEPIKNFKDKN